MMQSCRSSAAGVSGVPLASRYCGNPTRHPANRPQPRCEHAAVRQEFDLEGDIYLIVNQINDVISQQQSCIDLGIGLQEFEHDWLNVQPSEHDRCGDD